jgi:hypothetical protein
MKNVLLLVIHLLAVVAKLLGPGGIKAIIAKNFSLKQQLLVVCRRRQRAPNLLPAGRFLLGFFSLFLRPGRIMKTAVGIRPSTLLRFHDRMSSLTLAMSSFVVVSLIFCSILSIGAYHFYPPMPG